jgi:hypothetical protein
MAGKVTSFKLMRFHTFFWVSEHAPQADQSGPTVCYQIISCKFIDLTGQELLGAIIRISREGNKYKQEGRMATIPEEIHTIVERLSPDYQRRVLEFAQELAQTDYTLASLPRTPLPPGTPGSVLLKLRFMSSKEDVEAMERALEDCERIEVDEH